MGAALSDWLARKIQTAIPMHACNVGRLGVQRIGLGWARGFIFGFRHLNPEVNLVMGMFSFVASSWEASSEDGRAVPAEQREQTTDAR